MIEDFLNSERITKETGPSGWHFHQMYEIVKAYPKEEICAAIMESYKPEIYDRHQVAVMFNMLIWHSVEHDLEVSKYFKGWEKSGDKKIIGVCISRELEWFPFGTPEHTLMGIKNLKQVCPEFNEDYQYWEQVSKQELKRH